MQRCSWTTELRSSSQIYLDVPNFLRIFCEKISQCSWIVFSGVSLLLLEGEFSYSSFLFVDDGMFFLCIVWFASFFCYCTPLLMHCCFPSFCQHIVPLSRGYYDLLSRRLMAVLPFPLSTSLLLFTCMILFWIPQTHSLFFLLLWVGWWCEMVLIYSVWSIVYPDSEVLVYILLRARLLQFPHDHQCCELFMMSYSSVGLSQKIGSAESYDPEVTGNLGFFKRVFHTLRLVCP